MRSAGLQVIYKDKGEKETYEKTGKRSISSSYRRRPFSRLRQHKTSRDNSCSRHNGAGETQAEAAAGDVTIDVWHSMEGSNGEAFEAMVKNFNETTGKELGITANSVFQGSDTAGKLKTLIQTDDVANMPDVCLLYSASLPVVAEYKGTVAVDDMYGKGDQELSKEEINQSAIQTYSYKGKQVCMPFNSSTLLLYYNKDAFKEVGLDPEIRQQHWMRSQMHVRS